MFRQLLTPLSTRFALPPLSPLRSSQTESADQEDALAVEDFAQDALIEVMRTSVDRLKATEQLEQKLEILTEIHRLMLEDARTRDVFREMDGFLVVMNALSTIPTAAGGNSDLQLVVLEATRLVFVILAEALYQHRENMDYFKRSVGFELLSQAMRGLVSEPTTVKHTLGFLVALALHKFSMSGIFAYEPDADYDQLDHRIRDFESAFGFIYLPQALLVLYNFIPLAYSADAPLRYCILKLLERLSHHNHRNHCVLGSLDLVGPLFRRYCEWKDDDTVMKRERQVVQKLLRRLVDVGTTTEDARLMFQHVVREDEALDIDILEVLRAGMKVKWPEHFSLEAPATLQVTQYDMKGLPSTGFTFMIWLWVERFPTSDAHSVFTCMLKNRALFELKIRPDGSLESRSAGSQQTASLKATVARTRWTHITCVHHPHRSSNPTLRVFIDGILTDALNWHYPKPDSSTNGKYIIGDDIETTSLGWCVASAYFIASPIADSLPRFIHHLGPRYTARFQTTELAKFLTYEASTALHISLDGAVQQSVAKADIAQLQHAIKDGLGIAESSVIFAISTASSVADNGDLDGQPEVAIDGNVYVVKNPALDLVMWKIGGAAVALRLVQLATSTHELSRALGILTDGIRNSWQNSEDMEQLRGYDLLAQMLRGKSQLINITGYETLFEFLGLNFRNPDQSTVVNTVAYRALALDFQLWSSARVEIQRAHMDHFSTLLKTSKHKRFNAKQRIARMAVLRKLLFVLQTSLYHDEMISNLVETVGVVAQAHFTTDAAIKPIVSYLAANLHGDGRGAASPISVLSHIDYLNVQSKAEQVLEVFVSLLMSPPAYAKFSNALPVARVCLLLLGERPTSSVATQILRLLTISLNASISFNRKFELVSGWSILKTVLPSAWDTDVQKAAFDLLFGRIDNQRDDNLVVICPQVFPAVLLSLRTYLEIISTKITSSNTNGINVVEDAAERLLEQLINLHSTVPSFRQIFKSHATTEIFINTYRMFVASASTTVELPFNTVRILEKLSHFGLSVALDNSVSSSHKQEIMDVLQSAETVLNPRLSQETAIDATALVGGKARHRRIGSIMLSMHLGESAVKRSIARIHDWRRTVVTTERKRLRKTVLDLREYHRQISSLVDWAALLTIERGLWSDAVHERQWQLDETEGPYRVRKKLEPIREVIVDYRVDADLRIGNLPQPETDNSSVMQLEVPPWADGYDASSAIDNQLEEDIVEDKHRRVRHELEPGDVIEAVYTVARVFGVDSFPGLLIFGHTHLYILDGLVQDENGEIMDARDATKKLFFVPGSNVDLNGPQRAQRWSHDQILSFSDRTFLFRDVALEVYFKDSRSLLIVFLQKRQREEMSEQLSSIVSRLAAEHPMPSPLFAKSPLLSPMMGRFGGKLSATLSAKVLTGLRLDELSTAQRKWQAREISNFTYLSILNQISGRTPSDATQYPVFPWVLSDYSSSTLDLRSAASFRDLSRPMGALTSAREEAARSRYANLESVGERPFHYGTHFSSSMIVCHFLIRLEPFSHMFKTLQGGDWDIPDRLFSDIKRAYESASQDVRGDVRELITEFFSLPEFLENLDHIDFGVQQNNGEKIDDVKLPPWAKEDPLLFIALHRAALESDHVSEHLPKWIDLIWGYKQREADALNVFHPLSYEGSIDLDTITDELEREATVGIIHNFGQTPRKIFHTPHPERMMHGASSLPIGTLYGIVEDHHLLSQSLKVVKDLGQPVHELSFDPISQRIIPCPEGLLCVPSRPHEQVQWDGLAAGGDLKVLVDQKVVQVVEATACCCAAFADANTMVTGSRDYAVRLWRLDRPSHSLSRHKEGPLNVVLTHVMRAHTAEIVCVTTSRAWSIVVSGSKDGSAVVWDLNRGTYVRSLWYGTGEDAAVHLATVSESTGYIATCSRQKLSLHTINGRLITSIGLLSSLAPNSYPAVTSMAFLEREYSRIGLLATGGPDGTITLRTWNADSTPEGEKARWEFATLKTLKVKDPDGDIQPRGFTSCVTALKFVGECLYHGEDTGKVFSWDLPD
ncbi:beach-domain-containing protein [Laetiporus sulphureus 93-53]|uniref:Beach-domain-containing protein n=1 Tax=Laetiporus sulphureus 93-53 TaxID=1314785 RepID=A0A165CHY0_9APHY|nr:beach-domain-containing protein [Laetiporus sulphureus 93-53]KZT02850.1 beach-domain-containing protein [Laetiporus sulphureus 93-53]